ncbi:palmitoyltransferase [Anaeramoeba ignava]|uniref:Palmitoyltransferase n=1 Tax=Anaeramoeba ignava TaxID=1746090 RepID=A0A9Q0L6C7_ANAIG|nr:palmitoyltransferase [Anaeramoeba ignava]
MCDEEDCEGCPSWILDILYWLPPIILILLVVLTYYPLVETDKLITQHHYLTGTILNILYHFFLFMYLITLILSVLTNPGDSRKITKSIDIENGIIGEKRFCKVCNIYKPNRAHHCSICKRCVLKMDHHCPWISNCVGFFNYKYFILFLIYSFLISATAATIVIISFFMPQNDEISPLIIIGSVIAMIIGFSFVITLIPFIAYHLALLAENMTTIEDSKTKKDNEKHIWDLGLKNNLKQVLGENYLLWFLPTYISVKGDGFNFEHR